MDKFPFYSQLDMMDCGPACLRMIAKYYGNSYSLEMLRSHSFISREGVSMLGISDAAEYLGMHTLGVKCRVRNIPVKMFMSTNTQQVQILINDMTIFDRFFRKY